MISVYTSQHMYNGRIKVEPFRDYGQGIAIKFLSDMVSREVAILLDPHDAEYLADQIHHALQQLNHAPTPVEAPF